MIPKELVAARLLATRLRPYFSLALFALTPVESLKLSTLSCDAKYRLYYNPKVLQEWPLEELAGALIHEVGHLLRKHHIRATEINAEEQAWNEAADAEINDDILGEGLKLPCGVITPQSLNQPIGKLAEVYYKAIMAKKELDKQIANQLAKESNGSQEQQNKQSSENQQTPQPQDPQTSNPTNDENNLKGDSDSNSNSQQGNSSTTPQTTSSSPSNSVDTNSSSNDSSSSTNPTSSTISSSNHNYSTANNSSCNASNSDANSIIGNTNTSDNPNSPDSAANKAKKATVGTGRCGSCATGIAQDYEKTNDDNFPGLTQVETESLAKKVAKAVLETSASGRGNVPAGWKRWAEEKRTSKVDWRREMSSFIRASLATTTGAFDYSYSRPSRRQAALPNVVMPAMRKPLPSVAVVVDTSGSMTKAMLEQALAEIQKILTSLGHQGLNVIACDRKVHWSKKIFKISDVQVLGGGGTDMRIGISEALKLKPTPQLIITITDGDSPWPTKEDLKKTKLLITLTTDHWKNTVPDWAKSLLVR